MKTRTNKWKSPMIAFCFFLVFIFVLYLQYLYLSLSSNVYGINMQEFANNRNTYSSTLYAKRGTIYDVQGDILATDVSSYTVIAYLDESRTGSSSTLYHVQDKQKTAEALSPLLNMDVDTLLELLNKDAYQVELGPGGRGISEVLKKQIEELNLPGIDFIESYKRFYPNGDFASYLIGYAKKNEVMVDDKIVYIPANTEIGGNIFVAFYNDSQQMISIKVYGIDDHEIHAVSDENAEYAQVFFWSYGLTPLYEMQKVSLE